MRRDPRERSSSRIVKHLHPTWRSVEFTPKQWDAMEETEVGERQGNTCSSDAFLQLNVAHTSVRDYQEDERSDTGSCPNP